jgi:hypothetical protein
VENGHTSAMPTDVRRFSAHRISSQNAETLLAVIQRNFLRIGI